MKNIIESELRSLISLIDDPDAIVLREITEKIVMAGEQAVPLLEEKWESTIDTDVQQRVLDIIQEIQFNKILSEFEDWMNKKDRRLLDAALLLTRFQYAGVNTASLEKRVDEMRQSIWLEYNVNLTAIEKISLLNHFLFRENRLRVSHAAHSTLESFFLNNIIETRKGNPVSLGFFYPIIAQLLQLPVFGVSMQQHFILAYTNSLEEEKMGFIEADEVLFYIDPFEKGVIFNRKELESSIMESGFEIEEESFKPCSYEVSLVRYISELSAVYDNMNENVKVERLGKLIELLRG